MKRLFTPPQCSTDIHTRHENMHANNLHEIYRNNAASDGTPRRSTFFLDFYAVKDAAACAAFRMFQKYTNDGNKNEKTPDVNIEDLIKFIMEDEELWYDFAETLYQSNAVTNMAVCEILHQFIYQRQESLLRRFSVHVANNTEVKHKKPIGVAASLIHNVISMRLNEDREVTDDNTALTKMTFMEPRPRQRRASLTNIVGRFSQATATTTSRSSPSLISQEKIFTAKSSTPTSSAMNGTGAIFHTMSQSNRMKTVKQTKKSAMNAATLHKPPRLKKTCSERFGLSRNKNGLLASPLPCKNMNNGQVPDDTSSDMLPVIENLKKANVTAKIYTQTVQRQTLSAPHLTHAALSFTLYNSCKSNASFSPPTKALRVALLMDQMKDKRMGVAEMFLPGSTSNTSQTKGVTDMLMTDGRRRRSFHLSSMPSRSASKDMTRSQSFPMANKELLKMKQKTNLCVLRA